MDKLEILRSEKKALLQRLEQIEDVLRQHEELQVRIARLLASDHQDVASEVVNDPRGGGVLSVVHESTEHSHTSTAKQRLMGDERRGVSDSVRRFEELVTNILTNATRPMDRRKLLGALGLQGYDVPGKVPENTLGTRMTRMPGVANIRTGEHRGYWLETRLPELGIKPDDQGDGLA